MGVFITSSAFLRASKRPSMGVLGNSEGSGEKGDSFDEPGKTPWPFVMSGLGRAGMAKVFTSVRVKRRLFVDVEVAAVVADGAGRRRL